MKVKELIEQLEKLNPEEEIITAYWQHEMFDDIPAEHWAEFSCHAELDMDWSRTHEDLCWMWGDYKETYLKDKGGAA